MLLLSPIALFLLRLLAGGPKRSTKDDTGIDDDGALSIADDVLTPYDTELDKAT